MLDTRTYTMKPLMKRLQTTMRTLRFYEEKGLVKPQREGGRRVYSPKDVQRLELIMDWANAGVSLREIKQALVFYDRGDIGVLVEFLNIELRRLHAEAYARFTAVVSLEKAIENFAA